MKSYLKRILKQFAYPVEKRPEGHDTKAIVYSNLDEQNLILRYIDGGQNDNQWCVDIAASDGISMSNTYALFVQGWNGLAVEFDGNKFARLSQNYSRFLDVRLAKSKVTPLNVVALLQGHDVPQDFEFLNLDIDGYDYFVLEKILGHFRPQLICTEINEKIPPPIRFTVNWDENYAWKEDHFYGQSISQLHTLCIRFDYSLVELHYNNAFLMPKELCKYPAQSPNEAYERGYKMRRDRKEKFPWNSDMESLLSLPADEAVLFLEEYFRQYNGKFELSL